MIKINLLPPEIKAEHKRKEERLKLLTGLVVISIVFIVIYGALFFTTVQLKNSVKVMAAERISLETDMAKYRKYAEQNVGVISLEVNLNKAMGNSLSWFGVLRDLGESIPSNVWLTSFSLKHEDNGSGNLIIQGRTYDHPTTARWIAALRDMPCLTDIRTTFSIMEPREIEDRIIFEVKAVVQAEKEYSSSQGRDE